MPKQNLEIELDGDFASRDEEGRHDINFTATIIPENFVAFILASLSEAVKHKEEFKEFGAQLDGEASK